MLEHEEPQDLGPPPPREPKRSSLKRDAEAIVRRHRITFGEFKGRRMIDCDGVLPKRDYDILAEAMRRGLI